MSSEARVENRLRAAVKQAGGRCIKLPALWYRGIPDRLVLLKGGHVWFIELKRAKGRTTKQVAAGQTAWATFLRKYGFNFVRLRGKDEVEEFINVHIAPTV